MQVAVVTVGDELLAGDTTNTNATWLCDRLDGANVDVRRVTTVPDEVGPIARVVNEYRAAYDAVLVTGGLGPTHDDVTMEAVAAATGRDVEHSDVAHEWLVEDAGYTAADLDEGTASLPAGARPLHNEVGVAPGCVVESVYVLPGVPSEMRAMFEAVADEFEGPPRHVREVVVDAPESSLIETFDELRSAYDVVVGSYPGEYVRVKLTADDRETVERAVATLEARVAVVEE